MVLRHHARRAGRPARARGAGVLHDAGCYRAGLSIAGGPAPRLGLRETASAVRGDVPLRPLVIRNPTRAWNCCRHCRRLRGETVDDMKLTLGSQSGDCSVDFEPIGEFLHLRGDDTLQVEFPDGEQKDIQITYKENGISIWPDYDWIR